MDKRRLFENLRKVYCRVQPSPLHGVGVFAIRRIPKGINPFELPFVAELVGLSATDLRKLSPGIRQMVRQYAVKENGHHVVSVLGFNLLELEYFVNHSENPNLRFDDRSGSYRTARVIRVGEELTGDYNHYAPAMPAIRYKAAHGGKAAAFTRNGKASR